MTARSAAELDELEYQEFCIHAAFEAWQERQIYGPLTEQERNGNENDTND